MTTATKNLENDHFHILRLINVMGKITERVTPIPEHLDKVVELIRNFADGFHHAKEENLLFPSMVSKGFSYEQGPLAVMLHEHEQGRNFVRAMADHIEQYKGGDTTAITQIYENMNGYSTLLQAHIGKENQVLFRMADNMLAPEEQKELLQQFDRIENSNVCGSVLKNYIADIDELERYYF